MRYFIKALLLFTILSSCDHKNGNGMDNGKDGENKFVSRDSAISSVIQSLPQLFNEGQRKMYGLSESDLKSLTPGRDLAVRYLNYDAILTAKDSSIDAMLPVGSNDLLVPLAINNVSRLFVSLSNDKNTWTIGSVGNRRLLGSFPDAQNARNAELVAIPGLEIELVRLPSDSAGNKGSRYKAIETNKAAGLVKDNEYSGTDMLRLLHTYAQVLNRQFGDKLKTGEIDR